MSLLKHSNASRKINEGDHCNELVKYLIKDIKLIVKRIDNVKGVGFNIPPDYSRRLLSLTSESHEELNLLIGNIVKEFTDCNFGLLDQITNPYDDIQLTRINRKLEKDSSFKELLLSEIDKIKLFSGLYQKEYIVIDFMSKDSYFYKSLLSSEIGELFSSCTYKIINSSEFIVGDSRIRLFELLNKMESILGKSMEIETMKYELLVKKSSVIKLENIFKNFNGRLVS